MTLEVASLGISVKSDGVSDASKQLSGLGTSAKNAEAKVVSLTASIDKLMNVQRTATGVAITYANALGSVQQGVAGVNGSAAGLQGATASLVNAISSLTSGLAAAQRNFNNINTTVPQSTRVIQEHTVAMRDAHDVARGLAGGMGALWLTYGNIAPMVAGVAISKGFLEAVKSGSEFAYQLAFVKALGEETTQTIDKLGASTMELAKRSPEGPIALAQGLRILSQAGLDAADAARALPTALNLAVVGEMKLEQASTTLVGVMNAFKLSIGDMDHIGDVFAKAAAVSQTSVIAMTESMKAASVVGTQYNVSLEDTATALTLLAKVNIQGSAAGTAFRNMLKELYTPGKQATEVMKTLGLTTSTAKGELRPFADIVFDLQGKLKQYDKVSQVNILQRIFGERGSKEAIAMLSAGKEKWEELKTSIADSEGFIGRVASQLEMTTQGRFKQALSIMQTNMIDAFNKSEGGVRSLADALRNLADSPAFVAGMNAIVGSIAALANAVVTLLPALAGIGAAWGVFKVISLSVAGVAAATTAITGLGAAISIVSSVSAFAGGGLNGLILGLQATSAAGGVAAGATGLGGLATTLELLAGPAGWILAAITLIGTLTYAFYDLAKGTTKASEEAKDFTDALSRENKKLEEEIKLINESNEAKRKGIGVDQQKADAAYAEIDKLNTQLDALKAKRNDSATSALEKIQLDFQIKNLSGQINQAQIELDKGLSLVRAKSVSNMQALLLDMEDKANKLEVDAAKQGKKAPTAFLRAYIESFKSGEAYKAVTDSKVLKGIKDAFDATLQDAQLALSGVGNKKFQPEDKGAVVDAWRTELNRIQGEIEAIRDNSKSAIANLESQYKQGIIGEISLIERRKNEEISATQKVIDKLKEKLAVSSPENKKSVQQLIENEENKQERSKVESEQKATREIAEYYSKMEKDIQEASIRGYKARGEFAKAFEAEQKAMYDREVKRAQDSLAHETDPVRQEQIRKYLETIKKTFDQGTSAAEFKQVDFQVQASIRGIEAEVERLQSYTTDGSLISKLFSANAISNLYSTELPKLSKELETLKEKWLTSNSDEDKKAYETRLRDYYKFVKQQRDVYKDFIADVDKWGSEGFQALFNKTEGSWTNYLKKMKNSFKTMLIDEIYKMLAKPFMLNILAYVAGAAGMTGASGALAQAASAGNGLMNVASAGNSAYNLYNGNSSFGTTAGSYYGQAWGGNAFAANNGAYAQGFGSGLSGVGSNTATYQNMSQFEAMQGNMEAADVYTTAAESSASGEAAGSGFGSAAGYAAALYALSQGRYGQAVGTAIGTAILPGIGTIVGSILGSLVDKFTSSGGAPKVNINTRFTATGNSTTDNPLENGTTAYAGGQTELRDAIYNDVVKGVVAKYAPASAYDVMAGGHINIQGKSSNQDFAKIFDKSGNTVFNDFMESGKGTGDFQSWMSQEVPKLQLALVTDALRNAGGDVKAIAESVMGTATDLTSVINKMSATQITQTTADLSNLVTVFNTMKDVINKTVTGESVVAMSKMVGGIANLTSITSTYYDGYFSEAEKNARLQSQLKDQFDALNLIMPTTREGFRKLVEGLHTSTEAEQQTFIKVLSLAGSFGTFADTLKSLQDAANNTDGSLKQLTDTINASKEIQKNLVDKYSTDQQKLSVATAILLSGFNGINQKMPTTAEQFRDLALGADVNTESGRKLLDVLNQLAPAFDVVMNASKNALETAMSNVDVAMSKLSKSVDAQKEALNTAYDKKVQDIKDKAEADKQALQPQIESSKNSVSALNGILSKLESTAKAMQGELNLQQLSAARTLLNTALAFSNTGGSLNGYAGLEDALDVVAKPSEQLYASFEEYSAAQARTSNTIAALKVNATDQVSVAQLTLKATQDAITAIDSTSAASLKALDDQHTADIQRLDDILAKSQDQVNVLKGIDTSVLSVTAAVNALNSAITAAMVAKNGTATPATVTPGTNLTATEAAKVTQATNAINTLNNSDLFWTAKAGGSVTAQQLVKAYAPNWNPTSDQLAYWTNQIATQGATNAIAQFVNPQDMTAARIPFLNSHATGLERVPYDNYMAQLHEGEAVIDAPAMRAFKRYFNAEITPPRQDGRANEELCNEVRQLRAELQAANVAIAQNTGRTAKQLERWDGDGLPETRTV